jgi:hypothetical protein
MQDFIAKMRKYESHRIEKVAENFPRVESDLGLIFDRLEILRDVKDFNGLDLPDDSPMGNRVGGARETSVLMEVYRMSK